MTLDAKKAGEIKNSSPPSILDHLTSGTNSLLINDLDTQVQQQLFLAVARFHTTSHSVIHCLYDLAATLSMKLNFAMRPKTYLMIKWHFY